MKLVRYTLIISPHQLPQAIEFAKIVGVDGFRYIYAQSVDEERVQMGWSNSAAQTWLVDETKNRKNAREVLENCEVLISGICDLDLFESRIKRGLKTFYVSERWFKPFPFLGLSIPGQIRLLHPAYLRKALRLRKLIKQENGVIYLAMGLWAARDMAWMCGWGSSVECERIPGAVIRTKKLIEKKIILWGYFVEPSKFVDEDNRLSYNKDALPAEKSDGMLKLLWCGRLLGWKRVGDIVRAVGEHVGLKRGEISLTIVGDGPEKERLMKMADGLPIKFLPSQPIEKIREIMHNHDMYIFSSNQYEGWGAVVNEALIEGMLVIGTYEAGASVTMLPESALYHSGDWKALAKMISKDVGHVGIGAWSVSNMAEAYKRIIA